MFPPYAQLSTYLTEGRLSEGREAYTAAVEADDSNSTVWCWLSVIEERLGNHDGAVWAATRAYALSPNNVAIARQLIVTLKNSGRLGEVKKIYTRARRRWPNDVELKKLALKADMVQVLR